MYTHTYMTIVVCNMNGMVTVYINNDRYVSY